MTPLTQEIISRQATINIGTIGHVAHGKSTLVRAISGVNVSPYKFRNISFRLCVTIRSDSETSLSSLVMLTPSCISVLSARHLNATSHSAQRRKMHRTAPPLAATKSSSLQGMYRSSTAQVTMCSWLLCSLELQSWTQPYCWSQATSLALSLKHLSIWPLLKS